MNVCIIGGTGHIGGHLVPMLLREKASVTAVVRGKTAVPEDDTWRGVRMFKAEYAAGNAQWPGRIRAAAAGADVLIDLLGIDLSATYDAVKDVCPHVVACGSIWMLGNPRRVPCPAEAQREFWGDAYARRWRTIQDVLARSATGGPTFTTILPPNICGPGKIPLEPRGGRSVDVHRELAAGKPVTLPDGADVLIGPCDAEDVAQAFFLATMNAEAATGKIFNVGSAYALTATEFVETYAKIYGVPIEIRRVPWGTFASETVPDASALYHFEAHMCPDISPIRETLGCAPRHTPEQAMQRAVDWMRSRKLV